MVGDYFGTWRTGETGIGQWTSTSGSSAVLHSRQGRSLLPGGWVCQPFRCTAIMGRSVRASGSVGRNVSIRRQFVPDLERQTRVLTLLLEQLGEPAQIQAIERCPVNSLAQKVTWSGSATDDEDPSSQILAAHS